MCTPGHKDMAFLNVYVRNNSPLRVENEVTQCSCYSETVNQFQNFRNYPVAFLPEFHGRRDITILWNHLNLGFSIFTDSRQFSFDGMYVSLYIDIMN